MEHRKKQKQDRIIIERKSLFWTWSSFIFTCHGPLNRCTWYHAAQFKIKCNLGDLNCTVHNVVHCSWENENAGVKPLNISVILRHPLIWDNFKRIILLCSELLRTSRNPKRTPGVPCIPLWEPRRRDSGYTCKQTHKHRPDKHTALQHVHVWVSGRLCMCPKKALPLTMTTEGCAGSCLAAAAAVTALGSSSSLSSSMPSERPSTSLTVSSMVACLAFTVSILHLEWSEAICSW